VGRGGVRIKAVEKKNILLVMLYSGLHGLSGRKKMLLGMKCYVNIPQVSDEYLIVKYY
jgi:hypothetical protein